MTRPSVLTILTWTGGGLVATLSLSACATAPSPRTVEAVAPAPGITAPRVASRSYARVQAGYEEVGFASWYGDAYQGRPTASGERFDMHAASAAHPSLPLPCWAEITNLENGRSIRVRVNDRVPRHPGRVLDLSRGAAEQLGFLRQGLARVRLRYIGPAGAAERPVLGALERSGRPVATLDLDGIAKDPSEVR